MRKLPIPSMPDMFLEWFILEIKDLVCFSVSYGLAISPFHIINNLI